MNAGELVLTGHKATVSLEGVVIGKCEHVEVDYGPPQLRTTIRLEARARPRAITVDLSRGGDYALEDYRKQTARPKDWLEGLREAAASIERFGRIMRETKVSLPATLYASSFRTRRLGRLRAAWGVDPFDEFGPVWRLEVGAFELRRYL